MLSRCLKPISPKVKDAKRKDVVDILSPFRGYIWALIMFTLYLMSSSVP